MDIRQESLKKHYEWGGKIEYIGIPTTDEWLSIFDRDGAVELDTDIC